MKSLAHVAVGALLLCGPIPMAAAQTVPAADAVTVTHIGLTVSNMDRTIALFRDVLGAKITAPQTYASATITEITGVPNAKIVLAWATIGTQRIELTQFLNPHGRARAGTYAPDAGEVHIGITAQDFFGTLKKLLAAGFVPAGKLPAEGTKSRGLYLHGFDRLVIQLSPAG